MMKKKYALKQKNTLNKTAYPSNKATVLEWIRFFARKLAGSGLSFDNGMQNPYHEAEYLTAFAFSIPMESLDSCLHSLPPADARQRMERIIDQRMIQRLPAAYITREAFFAGHRFQVDSRVLIPRSRIENLFDDQNGFTALGSMPEAPLFLDLCTGSGCLAVALALAFPRARVHASDHSPDALAVARLNIEHFALGDRVQLFDADLFSGLPPVRYDLIVTNPPYVSKATMDALPMEYRHEPAMALDGGGEGLDLVGRIIRQAADFLSPEGVLICEVGDEGEETIMRVWPDFPGEWIYFHFGASGVFSLDRSAFPQKVLI
ncbi:MAG: 50S ribosomal protein L3 N(5)-glutamine methyltransferase [Magnetococcales bacterium]|nr:50S ribosomal protein L3 N(5)-glutamine methyltransferase [Magnetococcales bacterium]MBF0149725.1 50S ribosomal protein L3 N(5)-glutamine methyltransferase [Magnetococcales bacterium]